MDAVGLEVVANSERADGVGAVLVNVADPVTEFAMWNKNAITLVCCGGYVACDAVDL